MIYLRIAFRNLLQAKRRTFLLTLALFLVTAFLIFMLSFVGGLSDTMIETATTLSAGHVNVAGFYKRKPTDAIPLVNDASEVRRLVEENTPGLDYVTDRNRGWARVVSDTTSIYTALYGIDLDDEHGFAEVIRLAPEKEYRKDSPRPEFVGDIQELKQPDTVLIFASQAERLGVTVGDSISLLAETDEGVANTITVRIVAVAEDLGFMSNWNMFLPKDTVLHFYDLNEDTTGAVMVYLKDPDKADEVMGHLREVFSEHDYALMDHVPQPFFMKFEPVSGEDWTGQKLDLTTWRDEVSFLQQMITGIQTVSVIVVSILVGLIALGILTSMWIAVRERTQEIGTLRAIGMSRGRVLTMILTEAALLGLLATAAGALVSGAFCLFIDSLQIVVPVDAAQAILMSDTLNLSVRPMQLIVSTVAFTVIAAGSALFPAIVAAMMRPITAIHHVG